MANRNFASQKMFTMSVMPVIVNANITIGATGSVVSFTGGMIAGVTQSSTGVYVIALQNNFNGLHYAGGQMQSPSSGLSGITAVEIQNSPNTNITNLAAPSLTVKTVGTAGSLANPASGSVLSVIMYLSNSSVQIGGE